MRKYKTVKSWSLVKRTPHYLILNVDMATTSTYKYFIYQISFSNTGNHHNTSHYYIGSTNCYMSRINSHKIKLKNDRHPNKKMQFTFNQDPTNMKIKMIDTDWAVTRKDQLKREQMWINKLKPSLNLMNACNLPVECMECRKLLKRTSLKSHKRSKRHIKRVIQNVVDQIVDMILDQI